MKPMEFRSIGQLSKDLIKTNVTPYTDKLLMYMTADVSMDSVQMKFGDRRAFTLSSYRRAREIHEQGYFSINHYLVGGGLLGNINDGVTIGYPYSLNEKETEFFHQGKFVNIIELKSNFYRLTYDFNFISASGIYGVDELIKLASELTLEFIPTTRR